RRRRRGDRPPRRRPPSCRRPGPRLHYGLTRSTPCAEGAMSSQPPSPSPAPGGWPRLLGSDNVRLVLEFVLAAVLAGTGVALPWYHGDLAKRWAALPFRLWTVWVAAAAGLRWAGFFRLFGPVLFYDMVRTGRRPRHTVLRTLYVLFLLFIVAWVYWAKS